MKLKRIEEQVVVLVGATSGIGREAAYRFAERGARLVLCARNEDELEELAAEIRQRGGQALPVAADVTDPAAMRSLADRAAAEFGRIDTWIHCAGVAMWARFEETTPEEWERIIDVNLNGHAYGAMAALPYLRRQGGVLVLVSSVEARVPVPLQSAYNASKHGITGLARVLRMELQHEGAPVVVTEVLPSSINTPLFDKAETKLGVQPKPLPQIYEPRIAADALLYVAENPTAELVIGGSGKMAVLAHRFLPAPTEWVLEKLSFRMQRTPEPKSEAAPDNLFQPMASRNEVTGDFRARKTSLYTWLATHPAARWALLGAAAATVIGLRNRLS